MYFALENFPNYSLESSSTSLLELKQYLNIDFTLSKCTHFLEGKMSYSDVRKLPNVHIHTSNFNDRFEHEGWLNVKMINKD